MFATKSPPQSSFLISTVAGTSRPLHWHQLAGYLTINSPCSCVRTIEETLQELTPPPYSVRVSILSQCVTIRHPTTLPYLAIRVAIEDAGFDVADPQTGLVRVSGSSDFLKQTRHARKHLEQCQVCQHEFNSGAHEPQKEQPTTSLGTSLQRTTTNVNGTQESAITETNLQSDVPHRLTLSVSGMSRSSCTTAISQALSRLPAVHVVSISLSNNSATAILDNKVIAGDVLEAINSIGYGADIVSIEPLNLETTVAEMDGPLRVTFSVGGMTCAACTSTITQLLSDQDGVSGVSVNLIGNFASVVVESKELIAAVQEVIESAGYEASVVSVEPIKVPPNAVEAVQGQRTVALRIDGIVCD